VVASPVVIKLPTLHSGQREVIATAARFNVLACGRRWGKTVLGIDRLIQPALEGYPVAWFAPTYKMLVEVQRDLTTILRPVVSRLNVQEHRFELVTRGVVELWSLDNPDVARGRKYRRIVTDEAAMVRGLQIAWQQVLRPTLIDYQGDAWFLSTPRGLNFYKALYDLGADPEQPDWRSWRQPTWSNPYIAASEIEAARRTMTERDYRQEIEAEFLEGEGAVFRRFGDCATAEALSAGQPGRRYLYGVDWAQKYDYTAIVVLDPATRSMVALDRFHEVDYNVQSDRLKALFTRFPPALVIAESNAMGLPIIQRLQLEGWPIEAFETTAVSKPVIIQHLALAFETGRIRILPDPVLLAELGSYEQELLPSGRYRYSAPEGQHDDTVMALALAYAPLGSEAPAGRIVYDNRVSISPV
jgi:phage terminase large subunit-like protein